VLARSMKEWDRRPTERQGFNDGPADCLAFKYLRDVSGGRGPGGGGACVGAWRVGEAHATGGDAWGCAAGGRGASVWMGVHASWVC
jgi:hypothetical protein